MKKTILIIGAFLLIAGCSKEQLDNNKDNTIKPADSTVVKNKAGTYQRTIKTSDGQNREFIVYIPKSVENKKKVPVLFVIHGTGENGKKFYDNPKLWNAKSSKEEFIVVYPTALKYCHYYGNQTKINTTKWASGDLGKKDMKKGGLPLCEKEILRDDVQFFDELVSVIKKDYQIDDKRLYISGFSNGGQMAARLAAERSEIFASVVIHAGNLSFFLPANLTKRPIPMMISVGAEDEFFLAATGIGNSIPLEESLMQNAGIKNLLKPFLDINGLEDKYTYSLKKYQEKNIASFQFKSSKVGRSNYLKFVVIENLNHRYTNILINPYWDFLKDQSL